MAAVQGNLIVKDHKALHEFDAIFILGIVACKGLSFRNIGGAYEKAVFIDEGAGILLVFAVDPACKGVVNKLESKGTGGTEEGVHPFRIRLSRNFNEDLVLSLKSDIRLCDTELVDAGAKHVDIFLQKGLKLTFRGLSAILLLKGCSVCIKKHRHTSSQVKAKVQDFGGEILHVHYLCPLLLLNGIKQISFAGEGSHH